MKLALAFLTAAAAAALAALAPAGAEEVPKYGGTLTYIIPADAPPSFDAHREETYATIHSAAPFYSMLVRINPYDPASTTDIVCDLCTEMPKPTNDGKTYTFTIADGVRFTDGNSLTAYDVAASLNEIAFPPPRVLSQRSSNPTTRTCSRSFAADLSATQCRCRFRHRAARRHPLRRAHRGPAPFGQRLPPSGWPSRNRYGRPPALRAPRPAR